uniref:RRM domain-containing protein n=1 Tax=Kalanchoe fedtschenkoi TaxID=63787 RepID=A0A7N0TCL4_KALFE
MAVVENVESEMGSSDLDNSIQTQGLKADTNSRKGGADGDTELKSEEGQEDHQISNSNSNQYEVSKIVNGNGKMDHQSNGVVVNGGFHYSRENGDSENQGFKRDMKELEDLLSKLNPMAQEFVPISTANGFNYGVAAGGGFQYPNGFVMPPNSGDVNGHMARRHFNGSQKKNGYSQGKRRMNSRTSMAQREDVIRRTIYVSDIDQLVTEEQLAGLFLTCGQVVDCRICGDPNSVLRFAFLEFTDEESARAALTLSGTQLGYYPVKVMPSKTAIAPVNPTFLPRSEDEREMCIRTIYCTNIDRKITQTEVKLFFEAFCGEVHRLRLLGDYHHSTRIAFVEFVTAESAIAALNLSGSVLGSLPIRVSPSKTPVRPRAPRPATH